MTTKNQVKIPSKLYDHVLKMINDYRASVGLTSLSKIRNGVREESFYCPIACSLRDGEKKVPYNALYYRAGQPINDFEAVAKFISLIDSCKTNLMIEPIKDES